MRVKEVEGGYIRFLCPGCNEQHMMNVRNNARPRWKFNDNLDNPTLTPSILSRSGHYIKGHTGSCWCDSPEFGYVCHVCHSFVRDGKIQFLNDCTHELAGQTVDLPTMEEN